MSITSYDAINNLQEISMIAGNDKILSFSVYQEDQINPLDIANGYVTWTLCPYGEYNIKVLEKAGVITGLNTFTITLTEEDTITLSGKYIQQPTVVDSNGSTFRPGQGVLIISPAISPDAEISMVTGNVTGLQGDTGVQGPKGDTGIQGDSGLPGGGGSSTSGGDTAWTSLSLINGWTNYSGAPNGLPGYYKDSLGIVHLRGLLNGGTWGDAVAILPVGYRPLNQISIATLSNSGTSEIDVETNGTIMTYSGSGWFCLDGYSFQVNF